MAHALLFVFTLAALAVHASGDQFLKATPKERDEHEHAKDIQAAFLAEVEGALGTGTASSRTRLLEAILKPMYDALPKNEHGNLEHSTVRYALHRLFILRHGWLIKGLDRQANALNITSAVDILKSQVPAYIQDMFEARLGNKGLGLQDIAVMAATLEQLIHKDTVGKLGEAYAISGILPTEKVTQEKADELLYIYMMGFIIGEDITMLNAQSARLLLKKMPTLVHAWDDTTAFVRRIRSNITGDPASFDFAMLARVAEVVGEEFGTFQNIECRRLKDFLVQHEFRGTGRVKLTDFYKSSLEGSSGWHFDESASYLRQLGALDESDPNDASVIIPNYLHSQTNCIASSGGYYSVCCKDECEGLLSHVEEKIGAPEASPKEIVAIIEDLPSSSMNSSRKLSKLQVKRLHDIASEHGELVPFHGRLFAQWMHHAYPRECPYPQLSGTTSQTRASDFAKESGNQSVISPDEMREVVASAPHVTSDALGDEEELLWWSHEEELFVARSAPRAMRTTSTLAILRPVVLILFIGALGSGLVQSFRTTSLTGDEASKFTV